MRNIKFRGKCNGTGEWVYGDLVRNVEGAYAIIPPYQMNMHNTCSDYEVDPDTIGQFTGLHDKNRKEIYEGDVIIQQAYSGKKPMLVRFEHGAFVTGEHSGSSTATRPMLIQKRCEVLGNIYDNPGLISKKQ